jgi:endonuclease YncB( thermonuclease family)
MSKSRSRRRMVYPPLIFLLCAVAAYVLISCTFGFDPNQAPPSDLVDNGNGAAPAAGETATVLSVVDGDTIDVRMSNGQRETIRYLGVNTPERGETCYGEATQANRLFVENQTVTLVADRENRDRYDRLLRYVYVGNLFVNRALIEQGYGEVVLYEPNGAFYTELRQAEQDARAGNRGCHPTGIFNDGSDTR